jgi:hypothetical protein
MTEFNQIIIGGSLIRRFMRKKGRRNTQENGGAPKLSR